jgi:NAD(P)-dependent dehydrogenase (short-subunit alcohol dehydrogenase family)
MALRSQTDRGGACAAAGPRSLDDAVALVTGGGRGIGRMVATALASAGAAVGVIARSGAELTETVGAVEAAGGTTAAVVADVTDPHTMGAAVAELRHQLGPVDVLVNNAGVLGPVGPLWENDLDAWWATMDVNLRGLVLTSQLVLPEMIERRRGRILNITSQAGAFRWPLVSAYSVSKAAVVKLSENLAHETSRFGIAVFSVHPGLLPIGMTTSVAGLAPATPHVAWVQRWADHEMAIGRGADPDDAVDLIVRLAAGEADALCGRHLSVHDDLDGLLERLDEVQRRDLYVMRPERLPA